MTSPTHGRRAAAPAPQSAAPAAAAAARRITAAIRFAAAIRLPAVTPRQALSLVAMAFVAALLVTTSVPATALTATADQPVASVYEPIVVDRIAPAVQTVDVDEDVVMTALAAESYAVQAAPPPISSQVAGLGTIVIGQSKALVWPVIDPSRTSSGFGPRSAPCAGCSTSHDGVDFTPGNGTPVLSIADGVVVLATENGGGLGVNVEVQHNIDGRVVTSSYAHMQVGSIAVAVGQGVTAGQQLGRVGTTGQSTGPHLHLEMFGADGVRFDGMAWLHSRLG